MFYASEHLSSNLSKLSIDDATGLKFEINNNNHFMALCPGLPG